MRGASHAQIACIGAVAVCHLTHQDPLATIAIATVAAIGGLIPDLDTEASTTGSLLPHWWHRLTPGHRNISHAPAFLPVYWLAAYLILRGLNGGHDPVSLAGPWALTLGAASHILADFLTTEGVPLIWPVLSWRISIPKPFAFTTGTWPERVVVVASYVLVAGWMTNILPLLVPFLLHRWRS